MPLLLFFGTNYYSQINYVNNPSFEDLYSCINPNYVTRCKYWNSIDSVTFLDGGLCYNKCYGIVPYGGPGIYQNPKSGDSYLRTTMFCTNPCTFYSSRTYSKNRLKSLLTTGTTYCVKMYVNLENASPYAINNLQILLGDATIDTIKYCGYPLTYLNPQITNTLGIISDTLNWIEIKGTFTANGTEKYLITGNFNSDATTISTYSPTGLGSGIWSEYMIDDVSVIDFNLPAYAGPDHNITLGDSAFIGRPPEVGLECTWTTGTTTVGTGGGIWVKPTATGTFSYVVTQNICGNIKTDTVNVNISSGIEENVAFGNSIGLYPQPAKDAVTISLSNYYLPTIQVKVTDVNGKSIYSSELIVRGGKAQLETSGLVNGVYFLKLSNTAQQVCQKRIIVAK